MATDLVQQSVHQLESRVAVLEKRDQSGPIGAIGKLGIVVGCVGGILGGTNTVNGMWHDWTARPQLHTVVGDPLEMSWEPSARQLNFKLGVAVHNDGEMAGDVTGARAYLSDAATDPAAAGSPVEMSVSMDQNNTPAQYPLTVKPKDALGVSLTVGSKLESGPKVIFGDTGLRRLTVELQGPNKLSVANAVYCFWVGTKAAETLDTTNRIAYSMSDPRCKTTQ